MPCLLAVGQCSMYGVICIVLDLVGSRHIQLLLASRVLEAQLTCTAFWHRLVSFHALCITTAALDFTVCLPDQALAPESQSALKSMEIGQLSRANGPLVVVCHSEPGRSACSCHIFW